MKHSQVLVIDGAAETADVLKAVLEPRGANVCRVRRFDLTAASSADETTIPTVVIWDQDEAAAEELSGALAEAPRVVMGSIRGTAVGGQRFLEKPFRYPDLIQAIEELMPKAA